MHEDIKLEPSCESSDTSTPDSQIVDKPCDELELVHSSSPTAAVQTVMTGKIHEVQSNEHSSRDSGQSHMEVRESLYSHEIEILDDSHRKKIERVKESILAMKERTKILRNTILQQDVELTTLRVVCAKSAVRISSIEEQLDYLMGQKEQHTIAFQSNILQEYIDKACNSLSPHLHNGGWFLQVCQDREIGQQYMSILIEIRREKCQLGRIIRCDGAYGQCAFWGSDEIKGWCPIEWAILGKPFLARGIVPQQPWDI